MIKEKKQFKKGFTLIETLIAVTILLVSVAAPMLIAQRGLSSAQLVRNQITAFYLAQDAIEYAKNVRDENIITGSQWRNGLNDCESTNCVFDIVEDTITVCGANCDKLKQDSDSGLFGYDPSWDETIFDRLISTSNLNADETEVSVTVSWDQKGTARSIVVKENLLNWDDS